MFIILFYLFHYVLCDYYVINHLLVDELLNHFLFFNCSLLFLFIYLYYFFVSLLFSVIRIYVKYLYLFIITIILIIYIYMYIYCFVLSLLLLLVLVLLSLLFYSCYYYICTPQASRWRTSSRSGRPPSR